MIPIEVSYEPPRSRRTTLCSDGTYSWVGVPGMAFLTAREYDLDHRYFYVMTVVEGTDWLMSLGPYPSTSPNPGYFCPGERASRLIASGEMTPIEALWCTKWSCRRATFAQRVAARATAERALRDGQVHIDTPFGCYSRVARVASEFYAIKRRDFEAGMVRF